MNRIPSFFNPETKPGQGEITIGQCSCRAKDGTVSPCGDSIVITDYYIAVIDGATPKGSMLWDGKKGDVFASSVISDAVRDLPPDISAYEAIERINRALAGAYPKHGADVCALAPEERLQAGIVIYSCAKHEVWSFGDCRFLINNVEYSDIRKGDAVLSDLRALCCEAAEIRGLAALDGRDYGRELILPFLKLFTSLANTNTSFGYDVLDGSPDVAPMHVKVYAVEPGSRVVLASDGYPKLFHTLDESEEYLFNLLRSDPQCIRELRGTKGVAPGCESFDDRSYVSFCLGTAGSTGI